MPRGHFPMFKVCNNKYVLVNSDGIMISFYKAVSLKYRR